MDNTIRITGKMREAVKLPMCGKDSQGNLYEVDNLSLMKNGRRFLPVMGEFHFSRCLEPEWEEEIRKMKAILERDIAAKVAEFEQESCVQITDVGIDRVKIKMLNNKTVCQSITVNIIIQL